VQRSRKDGSDYWKIPKRERDAKRRKRKNSWFRTGKKCGVASGRGDGFITVCTEVVDRGGGNDNLHRGERRTKGKGGETVGGFFKTHHEKPAAKS